MRHVLLAVLILVGLTTPACCVTKEEYRAHVKASRDFFNAVSPRYLRAVQDDLAASQITSQTATNRNRLVEDYGRSLEDAEKRAAK